MKKISFKYSIKSKKLKLKKRKQKIISLATEKNRNKYLLLSKPTSGLKDEECIELIRYYYESTGYSPVFNEKINLETCVS